MKIKIKNCTFYNFRGNLPPSFQVLLKCMSTQADNIPPGLRAVSSFQ